MRPRRNTTPRSHSLMTYTEFTSQKRKITTAIPTPIVNTSISLASNDPACSQDLLRASFEWFDFQRKAFHFFHAHARAFRNAFTGPGGRAPQFAVPEDRAHIVGIFLRADRFAHFAHFPD